MIKWKKYYQNSSYNDWLATSRDYYDLEIDGYFTQALLTGRKCSERELKQKYFQAKSMLNDIRDLPDVFCRLHRFEKLRFDNEIEVDFVIDTDTDYIYTLRSWRNEELNFH